MNLVHHMLHKLFGRNYCILVDAAGRTHMRVCYRTPNGGWVAYGQPFFEQRPVHLRPDGEIQGSIEAPWDLTNTVVEWHHLTARESRHPGVGQRREHDLFDGVTALELEAAIRCANTCADPEKPDPATS